MNSFNDLRGRIGSEYKETVRRRYYTVTGESADESVVDRLISTGESETFLAKAIQEQGRGKVMDTIMEIQERHEGVKEIEKNLKELNQVPYTYILLTFEFNNDPFQKCFCTFYWCRAISAARSRLYNAYGCVCSIL